MTDSTTISTITPRDTPSRQIRVMMEKKVRSGFKSVSYTHLAWKALPAERKEGMQPPMPNYIQSAAVVMDNATGAPNSSLYRVYISSISSCHAE